MPAWATALGRVINGILNAYNQYKLKKAMDNAANSIAGNGRVLKSNKSFEDIVSKQPNGDRAE